MPLDQTRTLLVLAALLALAACTPEIPNTAAGLTCQAPVAAIARPANVGAICFDEAAFAAWQVRMVRQEPSVDVLSCTNADGSRPVTQPSACAKRARSHGLWRHRSARR
jgi:hypothetical protein